MDRFELYTETYAVIKEIVLQRDWSKRSFIDIITFQNYSVYNLIQELTPALVAIIEKHRRGNEIIFSLNYSLDVGTKALVFILPKIQSFKILIDIRQIVGEKIVCISEDMIKKLASTFVHEFVHYQQMSKNWDYFVEQCTRKTNSWVAFNILEYLRTPIEVEAWGVHTALELSHLDIDVAIKMLCCSAQDVAKISQHFNGYYIHKQALPSDVYNRYLKHTVKQLKLIGTHK